MNRLYREIEAYRNEGAMWKIENDISNSAGKLCLHLIGNLNAYIGQEVGGTGYVRNRDLEFSLKNVPRKELLEGIRKTIDVVNRSLDALNEEALEKEYPIFVFEEKSSTGYILIHLAMHLSYHLGQINYHRRLMDAETSS